MKINKTALIFIIFIFIITALTSCDIKDELSASPIEITDSDNTQTTPPTKDEQQQAAPSTDSKPQDTRRYDYIQLNIDGTEYYHFANEKVTAFDKIEEKDLESKNQTLNATYYAIGELDDYQPTRTARATLYSLPEYLQDNPYINVAAAKLENMQSLTFFWSFKQMNSGDLLQKRFEAMQFVYGYKITDPQAIVSIELSEVKSDGKKLVLTKQDEITGFHQKVTAAQYSQTPDSFPDVVYGKYSMIFKLNDDTKLVFNYNVDSGFIDNEYKVTDTFRQYFLTLI